MIPIKPMETNQLEKLMDECKGYQGKYSSGDLCFYVGTKEKYCPSQKELRRVGLEKDIIVFICAEKYDKRPFPDIK